MDALLVVLVLVVVWLASSAGWPYTACSASNCENGKVRSPGRGSWRTCRRCRGTGRRRRLGAILLGRARQNGPHTRTRD